MKHFESMNLFIENLELIYHSYGYEKYTIKFLDYYSLEIAKYLNLLKATKGLLFLSNFDYKNEHIYQKQNEQ